jgi:glycosyltransferase involved in cell wall biosynthesis
MTHQPPFKILIVAPRLPSPEGKADGMTVFFLVKHLAEKGHSIHLPTFEDHDVDQPRAIEQLRSLCTNLDIIPLSKTKGKLNVARGVFSRTPMQNHYYDSRRMQSAIDRALREFQPDVVYGHLIRVAKYLDRDIPAPKILAMQVSQTLNLGRLVGNVESFLIRQFYKHEYERVRRYEPQMLGRFDRVLLISPHDKNAIDPHDHQDNVFFSPHGIDVSYYARPEQEVPQVPNSLIMNGDFGTPTNVDAILYFHRQIFPAIKARVPDVRLFVVGRNPVSEVRKLETDPAVTVTGRVPDIRTYLHQASVAIDPLRIGAGLQNKVLVSMAARLPVVATSVANEGINAEPGHVIAIADDETAFANKVIEFLENKRLREQVGSAAQQFMFERWTWEYHFNQLEEMIFDLIANGPKTPVKNYYPF